MSEKKKNNDIDPHIRLIGTVSRSLQNTLMGRLEFYQSVDSHRHKPYLSIHDDYFKHLMGGGCLESKHGRNQHKSQDCKALPKPKAL